MENKNRDFIVNNLQQLKSILLDDCCDSTLNISLVDENNHYVKGKIKFLMSIDKTNIELLKQKINTINFYVPYEKIPYTIFLQLSKFYSAVKSNINCNVIVNHTYRDYKIEYKDKKLWDFKTIKKCNNYIYDICKTIKRANLSPAEALAYIHQQVSTVANYSMSDVPSWNSCDQYFAGAFLPKPEFVCTGYSSLMKEIIDELNMEELSCELIEMDCYNYFKQKLESHTRLMVELKDKKYALDRTVFDDATWDNDSESKYPKYAHFLMPMSCHEEDMSIYDYSNFKLLTKSGQKNEIKLVSYYIHYNYLLKKNLPLEQEIIEAIEFNMLLKTEKNKDFNSIYQKLKAMAKISYNEQQERKYKGTLNSESLKLSCKDCFKLYSKQMLKEKQKNTAITELI
ncbi:MAG: hypothetical protein ACI4TZ_03425 [Christensenellales bacterium]